MGVGDELSLYQYLKEYNKNASNIWEKVGFKTEFKKHFSRDEMFWASDMSFLNIYKMLKSEKEKEIQKASGN
jgi:hypothetical protein